jgi:2-keto-4-pentenoate hydratase/2-oxohepta-3-ene-1,7-dioic acid hydratase in catechol pathway
MRLARYRDDAGEWVGIVDGDRVTPIGPGDGLAGQRLLIDAAMAGGRGGAPPATTGPAVPLDRVELLCPVPEPPSVRDFYAFEGHVATARQARGLEVDPDWYELPVFYFTNPAAVLGPGEPVAAPVGCEELDYELEVAAVIGVECADVDPGRWLDVVAGFTILDDWSARDLQRREMRQGLGPAKGKDFATSLGPVLVTPDELLVDDVPSASMVARVNGQERSRGELASIHHGWGAIIAHASRSTRLRPGDVIGSGTVGSGCLLELRITGGEEANPWLQAGDLVELEVEGIGTLATPVIAR